MSKLYLVEKETCEEYASDLELFLKSHFDPRSARARHDSDNKFCAVWLLKEMLDRTTAPIRKDALIRKLIAAMEECGLEFDRYLEVKRLVYNELLAKKHT